MAPVKKRLLLLSCSQKKVSDPEPMPAIERYDGPSYRLIRKYLRETPSQEKIPIIYILSAELGLITQFTLVPPYDRRMTHERADELRPKVTSQIVQQIMAGEVDEIFVTLGKEYLSALNGFQESINSSTKITYATGSQGSRLTAMQKWLYGAGLKVEVFRSTRRMNGKVVFRGVELDLSKDQALEIGRQAIEKEKEAAEKYQAWYVVIDSNRVSPKWLVSKITGISVGAFHTSDAKRLLYKVGVEVVQS